MDDGLEEEQQLPRTRRRASKSTVSTLLAGNFGKLPPQAVDLEEAVLGALMLEKRDQDEAIGELQEGFFYKDTHQLIFKAIREVYTARSPVDILTVTNQLKTSGELDIVGGPYYITQLTNRVASSANIFFHIKIIKQKWFAREIIRVSSEAIKDSYEDTTDIFQCHDHADSQLQQIKETMLGTIASQSWTQQVQEVVKTIETNYNAPVKVTGVTTGSIKLNKITGGWQKKTLNILAARPGMGKTALVGNFIKQACFAGKSVAFFSLEMGYEEITKRFLSEDSGVFSDLIHAGTISNLQLDKIKESGHKLSKMNFLLNDTAAVNPNYVRSVCRARKKKVGLDLIVIDYLQLMTANEKLQGRNREQEVSSITSALKALAKELEVPVIALAQLNRESDRQGSKRPMLSQLRESGAIEQDADLVMAIYRPSAYDKFDKRESAYANHSPDEYARASELLILKNRHGKPTTRIMQQFYGELSRFTTVEDEIKAEDTPPRPIHKLVEREEEDEQPGSDDQTDDLPF